MAVVIVELGTESGTKLLSGLPKDAPLAFSYSPGTHGPLIQLRHAGTSVPYFFDPCGAGCATPKPITFLNMHLPPFR